MTCRPDTQKWQRICSRMILWSQTDLSLSHGSVSISVMHSTADLWLIKMKQHQHPAGNPESGIRNNLMQYWDCLPWWRGERVCEDYVKGIVHPKEDNLKNVDNQEVASYHWLHNMGKNYGSQWLLFGIFIFGWTIPLIVLYNHVFVIKH